MTNRNSINDLYGFSTTISGREIIMAMQPAEVAQIPLVELAAQFNKTSNSASGKGWLNK